MKEAGATSLPAWRRGLRAGVVLLPILGLGFWLGLGMPTPGPQQEFPKTLLPHIVETPPPLLMETDAGVEEVLPTTGGVQTFGMPFRLAGKGESGPQMDAVMESTTLSLPQAIRDYDTRGALAGWEFSPQWTEQMRGIERGSTVRVYQKGSAVRVVVFGSPLAEDEGARPVTVFTGTFGEERASGH